MEKETKNLLKFENSTNIRDVEDFSRDVDDSEGSNNIKIEDSEISNTLSFGTKDDEKIVYSIHFARYMCINVDLVFESPLMAVYFH